VTSDTIRHIADAARRWSDPEYGPRAAAVDETLEANGRFTEAAVTVAVNREMARLTPGALEGWAKRLRTAARTRDPGSGDGNQDIDGGAGSMIVGVLNPGNIPFVELQDLIAVLLAGWRYAGTVSSRSPALLPAFLADLRTVDSDLPAHVGDPDSVLGAADALIASGTDETMEEVRSLAIDRGIDRNRMWLRGHRIGVSVLDGMESEEEREGMAEDALLHEGMGCRSVAIVWAPAGLSPDPWLEAFAAFRAAFPAPDKTIGPLKMQQAFLEAVDIPHAWADDYQFLVSRGDPEAQGPGHVRWCEYDEIGDVVDWLDRNEDLIQQIYATERLARTLPSAERPGSAQRPELDWCPDRRCHADFFADLSD
jgi:hypothetical protein